MFDAGIVGSRFARAVVDRRLDCGLALREGSAWPEGRWAGASTVTGGRLACAFAGDVDKSRERAIAETLIEKAESIPAPAATFCIVFKPRDETTSVRRVVRDEVLVRNVNSDGIHLTMAGPRHTMAAWRLADRIWRNIDMVVSLDSGAASMP